MKICANQLCRKAHNQYKSSYCKDCGAKRKSETNREYNKRRAEHHSFYKSKEWQELRLIKLSMTPVCEVCWSNGRLSQHRLIVHHIVEIAADWSLRLSLDNLQTVCGSCHNRIHNSNPGGRD